jgi:hypothetical protein
MQNNRSLQFKKEVDRKIELLGTDLKQVNKSTQPERSGSAQFGNGFMTQEISVSYDLTV